MDKPDIISIQEWINESRYNKISGYKVAELIEYILYLEEENIRLEKDNDKLWQEANPNYGLSDILS